MEKTTFQGVVRSMAAMAGGPMTWQPNFVEDVRQHDPKLADLIAAKFRAIDAANAYCAARLEGR